jgi:hypothetical protein
MQIHIIVNSGLCLSFSFNTCGCSTSCCFNWRKTSTIMLYHCLLCPTCQQNQCTGFACSLKHLNNLHLVGIPFKKSAKPLEYEWVYNLEFLWCRVSQFCVEMDWKAYFIVAVTWFLDTQGPPHHNTFNNTCLNDLIIAMLKVTFTWGISCVRTQPEVSLNPGCGFLPL